MASTGRPDSERRGEDRDSDNESLYGIDRREEFTGRDSITRPTWQVTDQLNDLAPLIPSSDQRPQPRGTKLYVVLPFVLFLLASSLAAFFLYPRSVVMVDDGIPSVTVRFDHTNKMVQMNMMSTLTLTNPNFLSMLVQSVSWQVLYGEMVIGIQQLDNVTTIQPLSEKRVNYTVSVEIGSSAPYVYALCTMPSTKVHNIYVNMQTSVKTSYMVWTSQNSLDVFYRINCGSKSTYHQTAVHDRHRSPTYSPVSSRPL